MEKWQFIGLAGIILALVFLFGCVMPGGIVNTFSPYFNLWINESGIFIGTHEKESTYPYFYAANAYVLKDGATLNGQPIPLTTNTFDGGNGVCGIYRCPAPYATAVNGNPVYLAVASSECSSLSKFKIYERPSGTGAFVASIQFAYGEAFGTTLTTARDQLNTLETRACEDASKLCYGPYANCHVQTGYGTYSYTFTTGENVPYCGDGTCQTSESHATCPVDCPALPYCGDGTCNNGETEATCPQDCTVLPYCGDDICNNYETYGTCPSDCPMQNDCGNGVCDSTETSASCPADCPAYYCGDGVCLGSETFESCPTDCPEPEPTECSDGTAIGDCSDTTLGYKCVDGTLVQDASCATPPVEKDIFTQIGEWISQNLLIVVGIFLIAVAYFLYEMNK